MILFNAGNTGARAGWGEKDIYFRQIEPEVPVGHLVR